MIKKIGMSLILLLIVSACSRAAFATIPETSAPSSMPATPVPLEGNLPEEPLPIGAKDEFRTDFSLHTVPYSEVLSGGVPKDGIPAINTPAYVTAAAADDWLDEKEPVILVRIGDSARAYPLQILTWHEIVNDTLNGVPVLVSFCPLCNTAIAFDRRLDEKILDFGTTGRLRYSNLIMYDRQTESWWQQASGEGIAGELAGLQLAFLPANIVAWADFRDNYPDGDVLSRNTGYARSYGENPYPGYDNVDNTPFLYDGPVTPGTLAAMARVLTVAISDEAVAYPYDVLNTVRVVNDVVGDTPLVVLWQPGTASALGSVEIAAGEDVGAIAAFSRMVNGRELEFQVEGEEIVDSESGSTWDILGRAIDGPMLGQQLDPIVGVNHFWFSWAAFKPDTRVYTVDDTLSIVSPEESLLGEIEAPSEEEVKETVPVSLLPMDFEIILYQGQDTLGGETVFVSDIFAQGKPVVFVFWAGLCSFCRTEMPNIQEAYLEFGEAVNFIGVDVGLFTNLGSRRDAESLIAELGLEFPTGATMDFQVLPTYEVTGIPTLLFMKSNGLVVRRDNGVLGKETLYERIETLIEASQS